MLPSRVSGVAAKPILNGKMTGWLRADPPSSSPSEAEPRISSSSPSACPGGGDEIVGLGLGLGVHRGKLMGEGDSIEKKNIHCHPPPLSSLSFLRAVGLKIKELAMLLWYL
ncbi:hypothetical protein NL676_013860 [Syzygium grande]|nr:hypothetical protein NL676_013860 [Syzygium grande]